MNNRNIELTNSETSTPLWVRAAHVDTVLDTGSGHSAVSLAGLTYDVDESYSDVVARLRVALHD